MRRIDYVAVGILLATGAFMILGLTSKAGSADIQEADRTFLVDRLGERWDITQAVSMGFDPRGFEFGIGRDAFTPLTESDWRQGNLDGARNQRVIGVAVEGQAHAYSVSRLVHHETANTVIGGRPIVVGYWPLVDLAAVYSREIDGQALTLAPAGWTFQRTFVLYDRETGTLWYPDGGALLGIQGSLFQRRLPQLPSKDTTWNAWREAHPHTRLMD